MRRIFLAVSLLLLLLGSASAQGVIGGDVYGGSGGSILPLKLSPALWLDASEGYCWQDAAAGFVAADKSWLVGTRPTLTDTWMFCAWFRKTATAATKNIVSVNDSTSVANSAFALRITSGNSLSMVCYSSPSTVVSAIYGTALTAHTWYFVAGGYNAVTGKVFISVNGGALVEETLASVNAGAVALTVGGSSNGLLNMDGAVDSLMFFRPTATDIPTIIAWAYNAGAGRLGEDITSAQKTAWGAISCWDLNGSPWVDSWGTNHLSFTSSPIIQPATYGAELLTNGGFETVTSAGPPTNFETWVEEITGTGTIEDETAIIHGESHAVKLTAGTAVTDIHQSRTVVSGNTYVVTLWTRGDGGNAGRYAVYHNSGYLVPATSTNVTGTNWTKVSFSFTATTNGTAQLQLFAPTAAGGIAYFDDVSLTQITTAAINNGGFEDWTVPSAAELVTNGNFTSDISGWTNNATYPWDTAEHDGAGGLHIACNGDGTPTVCMIESTAISLTSGAVYRIRYSGVKNSGYSLSVRMVSASGASDNLGYSVSHADSATVDTYFVATATDATAYLQFYRANSAAGDWTVDSVSITQVPSNATTWTESVAGSSLIYRADVDSADAATDTVYSGSHALAIQVDSVNSSSYVYQSGFTANKLYSYSVSAKAASATNPTGGATPTILVRRSIGTTHNLGTSYAVCSGTVRPAVTTLHFGRGTDNSNTVFIDSITVAAAEILPVAGIVRGLSQDSNFAVQLNGTTQKLSYTGTAFDPGTGDCSLSCWFYLDKIPLTGTEHIFSAGTIGDGNDFISVAVTTSSTILVRFNDSSGDYVQATSTSTVAPGQWYHLVCSFDRDGNYVGYVNGSATGWGSGSIAAKSTSVEPGNFYIGSYSGSSDYFDGYIDNACYVNRVITADEIAFLYNSGEGRQWSELGVAGTDGANLTASVVKGFWEFDTKASLGTDSTTNTNSLTPAGTPTQGMGINYVEGQCSYWTDRSTNSIHATSTVLAQYPSWVSSAINGRAALRFDGVDDFLSTTLAGQAAATIFFVGKFNAEGDAGMGVMDSFLYSTTGNVIAGGVAAQSYDVILTDASAADYAVSSLAYDGSNVAIHVNGVSEYAAAQSGVVSTALTYAIGARRTEAEVTNLYLDGEISEIIVYGKALTATERGAVTSWLMNPSRYNISP